MTTKNCANGPNFVLKDLREKSFVQNVRLPFFQIWHVMIVLHSVEG